MSVGITIELAIAKVFSQQAELPQVVRDVFAYVRDGPVGAHDHLSVFIRSLWLILGCRLASSPSHHPAALVLALGFEVEHAFLLELLESQLPEVEMQDLAFLGQKVILDVEPLHGRKMPTNDGVRNQAAHLRCVIAAAFDVMQGFETKLQALFVLLVPRRDTGIKVPAVVLEGLAG